MKMVRRVIIGPSERVQKLAGPFLSEIEGLKRSMARRGRNLTDLARLDIELAESTPPGVVDVSEQHIKQAFAQYLASCHHAVVDPDTEMLLLPGFRPALLLIGAYLFDASCTVYFPDPGLDAYRQIALLFGVRARPYPLYLRNDYLPNLEQFAARENRSRRILIINSPHNPTGAAGDQSFHQQLYRVASESNLLVISDAAYGLSASGQFRPPLFSEHRRHLRVGLEAFSFSTALCLPDLKLTALVGARRLIAPLTMLARSLGLVPPLAVLTQVAGYCDSAETLQQRLDDCRRAIAARQEVIAQSLGEAGIEFFVGASVGFVWVRLKRSRVSLGIARSLLRRKGVAVAPGSAFGEEGEGWLRIAANVDVDQLREAMTTIVGHLQPIRSRLKRRSK